MGEKLERPVEGIRVVTAKKEAHTMKYGPGTTARRMLDWMWALVAAESTCEKS